MKTKKTPSLPHAAYMCNVPITHREITIVTSDSALDTVRHSSRVGMGIAKMGMNSLVVNCGISSQRFSQVFREDQDLDDLRGKGGMMYLRHSCAGNLAAEQEDIRQIVKQMDVRVVIITGWEFTSSNYRRRQKLLFFLRTLMEETEIAVIIYCHCANQPVAGKIDKGGIGKLSMLATHITKLEPTEEYEDKIKRPTPQILTYEEIRDAEWSAQVLINKINNLGTPPDESEGKTLQDVSSDDGGSELVTA